MSDDVPKDYVPEFDEHGKEIAHPASRRAQRAAAYLPKPDDEKKE